MGEDMSDVYDAVKSLVDLSLKSYGLADYRIGTVVSADPLEIRISDRLTLDREFLLLTQTVMEKTVNVKHRHIETEPDQLPEKLVIREGLKRGDKVLLLMVERGQKYIVLSKVVD